MSLCLSNDFNDIYGTIHRTGLVEGGVQLGRNHTTSHKTPTIVTKSEFILSEWGHLVASCYRLSALTPNSLHLFWGTLFHIRTRQSSLTAMANVPEDILILIFRHYLEEPSTMPISLVPVCRQWRNLIQSTPSLWSRVTITIRDNHTIPSILSSPGFHKYLSITDELDVSDGMDLGVPMDVQLSKMDLDIPLDIQITFNNLSKDEHDAVCGNTWQICLSMSTCRALAVRQEQLNCLFAVLAGFDEFKTQDKHYWPTVHGSFKLYRASSSPPGSRIRRWRSFLFQSTSYEKGPEKSRWEAGWRRLRPSVPNWLQNQARSAPKVRELVLRSFPPCYLPHKMFIPNVENITLQDIFPQDIRYTTIPSLRSLTLQYRDQTPIDLLTYTCSVEELKVRQGKDNYNIWLRPDFTLPNLKRLELEGGVDYPLLLCLTKQFEDSNRRLGLVRLINLNFIPSIHGSSGVITNSKKLEFKILSHGDSTTTIDRGEGEKDDGGTETSTRCNTSQEVTAHRSINGLSNLLGNCAPDTEIKALDEYSAEILAHIRTKTE